MSPTTQSTDAKRNNTDVIIAGDDRTNHRLVATGLPTPVTAPPVAEPPELAVTSWATPPTGDPAVETVTGWAAAYVCGQGDVSRWTAPGLRLDAVSRALDQALHACPNNEALTRTAMELEAQAGHRCAADHRYQALTTQLARDDLEPDEETIDLHRRLARPDDQIG